MQPVRHERSEAKGQAPPEAGPRARPEFWDALKSPWTMLALGVALAIPLRWNLAYLLRDDLFADDASQHVFWFYRFLDPALFPNDPIADFFASPTLSPPGYRMLYAVLVRFMDPQFASELIAIILTGLMLALAWLLGRRCAPGRRELGGMTGLGIIVGLIFVMNDERIALISPAGLQRMFALPLLMFAVWGLIARRAVAVGLALFAAALFYPILLPNLLLLTAIVEGVRFLRTRRLPPGAWIAVLLAVVSLLAAMMREVPEQYGPMIERAEAKEMPEFGRWGRNAFFHESRRAFYFESDRPGIGYPFEWLVAAGVLVVGAAVVYGPRVFPLEAWTLLGVSFFNYALAHLLLFRLYLPNRYTFYALPIVAVLMGAALAPRVAQSLMRFRTADWIAARLARRRVAWTIAGVACVGLAAWAAAGVAADLRRPSNREGIMSAARFLKTLPKDTLIAGHPRDVKWLPLMAQRPILASQEAANAYWLGFYATMKPRILDEVDAFYARDWSAVDRLHERYGVDLVLVNRARFETDNHGLFQPFHDRALEIIGSNASGDFVLRNPPPERVVWRSGDLMLVRLGATQDDASGNAIAQKRPPLRNASSNSP